MKRIAIFIIVSGWIGTTVKAAERPVMSSTKSDETVLFFTTDAHRDQSGKHWIIPIHAWVFEQQKSSRFRKAAIEVTLKNTYELSTTSDNRDIFNRRILLLLADNERRKRLTIEIAGTKHSLPVTESNGHTTTKITLKNDAVTRSAKKRQLRFFATLDSDDDRTFVGTVNLVENEGLCVISDIDDTVKITEVTDRKKMFTNTFYREFQPVPGMAQFYRELAKNGATFHFVSSSPWHFYTPLEEFLNSQSFPARSMNLKLIRFKDSSILNLFKAGTETKPIQIEPILRAYPKRRFVLVGDSGEQDPEVYSLLMKKYPKQIEQVLIRNVTNASDADLRFTSLFKDFGQERWKLFTNPSELKDRITFPN